MRFLIVFLLIIWIITLGLLMNEMYKNKQISKIDCSYKELKEKCWNGNPMIEVACPEFIEDGINVLEGEKCVICNY